MFWILSIFVVMLADVFAVIAGNAGFSLPMLPICAFYLSMKTSPAKAFPMLVIGAGLLDAIWMHRFPGELLAVLVIMAVTVWWRSWGDLLSWTSLLASALFVAFASWLGRISPMLFTEDGLAGRGFSCLGAQLLWTLLLLPLSVWLLECLFARRISGSLRDALEEDEE